MDEHLTPGAASLPVDTASEASGPVSDDTDTSTALKAPGSLGSGAGESLWLSLLPAASRGNLAARFGSLRRMQ